MFHFPASTPTQTMYSPAGNTTQLMLGFPIRTSSDQRFVGNSPRHNAASHVLHRLSMPRHPPYARNKTHGHTNNQGINTKTQKRKILASTIQFSHNTTPPHQQQQQPSSPAKSRAQQGQTNAAPDTQQCTNHVLFITQAQKPTNTMQHTPQTRQSTTSHTSGQNANHPQVHVHPVNNLKQVAVTHSAT